MESTRCVEISVSHMGMDDAPVSTPSIPGFGSLETRFTRRDTLIFQGGVSWNDLAGLRWSTRGR
jgi:hypothetical protein